MVLRDGLAALVGKGVAGLPRRAGCGRASTSTPPSAPGREISERLMREGILVKDTHGSTIRLAPPLTITGEELQAALAPLEKVLG